MGVGEKRTVTIPPKDAFGEYNPDLVAKLNRSEAPGTLEPGMALKLWTGQKARVTEVDESTFTIDMNPQDAGKTLVMDVEVLETSPAESLEKITVAGGCFWGMELAFQREPGVISTKVGYTQGKTENPTYSEVCSGKTGHTEAVEVMYDPDAVSYKRLLEIFFSRHDPTQVDGQGNDRGTQYRGGIYYHSEEQCLVAKEVMKNEKKKYSLPLATELLPSETFYDAEEYHQQYLQKAGQDAKKESKETIRCYG
ncbi:unnamed protein product [Discosporangium mesarthrocarpum]